jgi:hypothetical protein
MEYDWDGGVICDVIVCSEQEAQAEYLYQLNQLLLEGEVTKDTLDQLEEAMGVAEHPFWQMHRPVIYYANYHEVHDGY